MTVRTVILKYDGTYRHIAITTVFYVYIDIFKKSK